MNYEAILFLVLVFVVILGALFLSVLSRLGLLQWTSRFSKEKLNADLPSSYVVKGLVSKDFIKLKKIKIAGHIFYVCEGLVAGQEGEEKTVFIVPIAVS